MTSKTIHLEKPFVLFDKQVTELEIKEPTGRQYADIGEPFVYIRNADGAVYSVEQTDVIKSFLDVCIAHDSGAHILGLLSLIDFKKVKRALLDFFTDADAELFSKSATA